MMIYLPILITPEAVNGSVENDLGIEIIRITSEAALPQRKESSG